MLCFLQIAELYSCAQTTMAMNVMVIMDFFFEMFLCQEGNDCTAYTLSDLKMQ